jgi:hypothetical protein
MANTVNDAILWGLPPRCILLSQVSWERKFYGICFYYYTLHLTFDINYDGFDRDLVDEGTKVLNGQWDPVTGNWVLIPINGQPPNYQNPQHYRRWKDRVGENMKGLLNGAGLPAGVSIGVGTGSANVFYLSINDNNMVFPDGGIYDGWVACFNPLPSSIIQWDQYLNYNVGDCVSTDPVFSQNYVCIQAITLPYSGAISKPPAMNPSHWVATASDFMYQNMGVYNPARGYNAGQYVFFRDTTLPAKIHVAVYQESDFTQLGIPLTF